MRKSCAVNSHFISEITTIYIQGGSDISGTISKLHRYIKKSYFLLIILLKSISAVCRRVNKKTGTFRQDCGSGFGIRVRIQEGKNDPQK
jgi:hypothetical protein